MRLSTDQVLILKKSCLKWFGSDIQLWLFGSRTDDFKKGGDIDLYLHTKETNMNQLVQAKLNFLVEMQLYLGEQKIDLLISNPQSQSLPIYQEAMNNGIQLI